MFEVESGRGAGGRHGRARPRPSKRALRRPRTRSVPPSRGPARDPISDPHTPSMSQSSQTMPRNLQPVRLDPELSRPAVSKIRPGTHVATLLLDPRRFERRRIRTPGVPSSRFREGRQSNPRDAGPPRHAISGALSQTTFVQNGSGSSGVREGTLHGLSLREEPSSPEQTHERTTDVVELNAELGLTTRSTC